MNKKIIIYPIIVLVVLLLLSFLIVKFKKLDSEHFRNNDLVVTPTIGVAPLTVTVSSNSIKNISTLSSGDSQIKTISNITPTKNSIQTVLTYTRPGKFNLKISYAKNNTNKITYIDVPIYVRR